MTAAATLPHIRPNSGTPLRAVQGSIESHGTTVNRVLHARAGVRQGTIDQVEQALRDLGQGVILKAPDVPEIVAAVDTLADAGVPAITLVTDLPGSDGLSWAAVLILGGER